jgi:hypothetical protein
MNRETPFGPLEPDDVSTADYERAIQDLSEFLTLDTSGLQTIEDLSAEASVISKDLRHVVLAAGNIQETKFDYTDAAGIHQAVDRTWVIRKPVNDHAIFVTANSRSTYIDAYRNEGRDQASIFNVHLPAGDITSSSDPLRNSSQVYAVDWRGGRTTSYYPANEPNNPQVQQGFARVLQDAVRDVLAVVPPPPPNPPIKL